MANVLNVNSPIVDWLQHSMIRTVSVVVGLTVLVAIPFFAFQYAYNKGASDYALKHPTTVYTAPCTQNYVTTAEKRGFQACIFPLRFGW